jgi:integrase
VNDDNTETEPSQRKREQCLSPDGKWRSFPKVPNLLQYVSNSNYYGRIKVGGKLIHQSLKTDVWTTAKLRLHDFLKKQKEDGERIAAPGFKEAVALFKQDLDSNSELKPQSKRYRLWCLQKLETTWPEVLEMPLDEITEVACKEWAAKLKKSIACHYYNNTIGTLKQILQIGIKAHQEKAGVRLDNPAIELKRTKIKQKDLQLPERSQFREMVANLRKDSGGWGPRIGDLVEFLAYSGMRIASEAIWVNWEDVDWKRREIIVRGHPDTSTKNNELRRIPIIEDMANLLERMRPKTGDPKGPILKIARCNEALKRVCAEMGIKRLTHHDLRHLFATICIESGVDIPTVARWLGHKDGGALALKTYGHLRNEHSQEMAKKVKF